jgi:5-methylcytosine-specific restriction endonuclease McrA
MKICTKCLRVLPESEYYPEKRTKIGLQSRCKRCIYEYAAVYRQSPEAKKKKSIAARKYGQSEKGKATLSAYAATGKTQQMKKAYASSDIGRAKKKGYASTDEAKEKMKICQQRNHIKEARKLYKQTDQGKEANRKYRNSDKGKANAARATYKRRALDKMLPSTLTAEEWEQIKKQYKYRCVYCGEEKELTRDHIIPLTKGGAFTKDNVVPACRSCNATKHTKPVLLQLLVEASGVSSNP